MSDMLLCPTCAQPAVSDHAGVPHCGNEACPEYGQTLQADEPILDGEPHPNSQDGKE